MNRIAGRAGIAMLLALLLLAGFTFFVVQYCSEADAWVIFPGSPHVYYGGNIGCGVVTDREGHLLLDMNDGRTYASAESLRKATIHWVGDRKGSISAPALSHYSAEMAGYDLLNGVYHYGEQTAVAELTLSGTVQQTALAALEGYKGTVAVYHYQTGQLLCAVTSPTYDPDNIPDIEGDTTGAYEGVYVNRFTQSAYIPGSIFKTVTLAAALEAIPDIQQRSFACAGKLDLDGHLVSCERAHGTQDLQTAFRNSCNCAFAQLALELGAQRLDQAVKGFDVTEPVEFDGIRTAAGNFSVLEETKGNLAWSAIGQHHDLINPCAFLRFMGVIAGGGRGAEPYLVEQITIGKQRTYQAEETQTSRLMSAATAKILQEYMRSNVEEKYGDGYFPGLTVCAKTGTAEVGDQSKSNAMLCGFVTDEKYPLAFVVCVEKGGYGAETCLPIASAVLAACKSVMDQ